jgi:CheY-like chemotaxis protein
VLVAEDEALIAMEVEAALRRAGWEVVGPVARAAEAARLAAGEQPLDAAVLDIGLGDATVFAAADALAARGVPLVFLTGYGPGILPERLRGRPVLRKPFPAERLARSPGGRGTGAAGARAGPRRLGARGPARRRGGAALGPWPRRSSGPLARRGRVARAPVERGRGSFGPRGRPGSGGRGRRGR